MRELLSPLSTGTIEFSEKPIGLSRSSIVKGNRESVVPQAGRGEIWLDSTDRFLRIDRSTKRSESPTKGLSARQRRGECSRVCNRNPRTLEAFRSRIQLRGPSAAIRRSAYGYSSDGSGDGTITLDQSGLESRWNFFFLPFPRFPPAASSPRVRSRNATWLVNNNFEWKKKVFVRLKGTVEQALHLDRLDLIETNQWRGTYPLIKFGEKMQEKKGKRSMGAWWRDTRNNERLKGENYSINSINFSLSSLD